MRVTLEHGHGDATIKVGGIMATMGVTRVKVTTPVGWGMYIKAPHASEFVLVGGEGPQYPAVEVMDMLAEAERLGAESCLVLTDREPPVWTPTYGYRDAPKPRGG